MRLSRKVGVAVLIAAALIAAFIAFWFQPQKLVLDDSVNEAAPTNTVRPSTSEPVTSVSEVAAPTTSPPFAAGTFRRLSHQASGNAQLIALQDGSHVLRLEDLDVENGPDLRVYLSTAPSDSASESVFDDDFVDLGALKGNQGSQNYEVPAGTDLARFNSAVIWCRRFSAGFAAAPLRAAG